jgi:hypothetical protein
VKSDVTLIENVGEFFRSENCKLFLIQHWTSEIV